MTRLKWFIYRFRFTLLMEGLLVLTAILTGSYAGELSPVWLDRLGFAPIDLLTPDFWRIATSAVATSGLSGLLAAMAAIGAIVGAGEWLAGSRYTAWIFWGVHVATLAIESLLIALPLHRVGSATGTLLTFTRDVGPSAGYFGVLGMISARLKKPWNWISGLIIISGLAFVLWNTFVEKGSGVDLSASLAHLIAFPLAWGFSHFFRHR